ncbi:MULTISPECIES: hypothetical protein [unclassified Janthinobacterium]|uniref:hypothetical protein n=1 Tax=unclassified Janthinobacterium TaxID=2610881 RepID=UPI0012F8A3F3|nr:MULTISPECIES: hypothetical protein [unclassified Janthinobacterium]MEC5164239.1 hypothetical protein [Janthinobacterium sp. CG_S6]
MRPDPSPLEPTPPDRHLFAYDARPEPTALLTLEIPVSLHWRIKMTALRRRLTMRDDVIALLVKHYPAQF